MYYWYSHKDSQMGFDTLALAVGSRTKLILIILLLCWRW